MMHCWLTEKGSLHCLHLGAGKVDVHVSQSFVRIAGARVNVKADALGRKISGCGHPSSTNSKPCTSTISVAPASYSRFIRISGKPVCLDGLVGTTDSVPPSAYKVTSPGQLFVRGQ